MHAYLVRAPCFQAESKFGSFYERFANFVMRYCRFSAVDDRIFQAIVWIAANGAVEHTARVLWNSVNQSEIFPGDVTTHHGFAKFRESLIVFRNDEQSGCISVEPMH